MDLRGGGVNNKTQPYLLETRRVSGDTLLTLMKVMSDKRRNGSAGVG